MVEVACDEANEDVSKEDEAHYDEVDKEECCEDGFCSLHAGNDPEVTCQQLQQCEQ